MLTAIPHSSLKRHYNWSKSKLLNSTKLYFSCLFILGNGLCKTTSKLSVNTNGQRRFIIGIKLIKYRLKCITTSVKCYFIFDGYCEQTFKVKRIFFFILHHR